MKKVLVALTVAAMVTGVASAQISGSKHDLSSAGSAAAALLNGGTNTEKCVYCHTPHQTASANGQDPLWNHTASSAGPYTNYASSTLNATIGSWGGGGTAGSLGVSQLCMSCHDGTVGVGSMYNVPNSGTFDNSADLIPSSSTAYVGTDLSNDHPVNFNYAAARALDAGLVTESGDTVNGSQLLFSGTVQCASCHDAHNTTNQPFLVMSNSGSALCLKCHVK